MSTDSLRPLRMPREERRRQLLDAALQVFVEHGYHGTSMDDIALAAQVSKPVLYQHFPGKHELFLHLMDTQIDLLSTALIESLSSAQDNKQRVHATIRAYLKFMDSEDRAYRLLFDSGLNNDPDVASRLHQLNHEFASRTADVIAGDTRLPHVESLLLGHALAGMVQTAARDWVTLPHDETRPSLDEATDLTFRLAWRGISRFPKEG